MSKSLHFALRGTVRKFHGSVLNTNTGTEETRALMTSRPERGAIALSLLLLSLLLVGRQLTVTWMACSWA